MVVNRERQCIDGLKDLCSLIENWGFLHSFEVDSHRGMGTSNIMHVGCHSEKVRLSILGHVPIGELSRVMRDYFLVCQG